MLTTRSLVMFLAAIFFIALAVRHALADHQQVQKAAAPVACPIVRPGGPSE